MAKTPMLSSNATPEERIEQVQRCLTLATMTLRTLRDTTNEQQWCAVLATAALVEGAQDAAAEVREAIEEKPIEAPHPLRQCAVIACGNLARINSGAADASTIVSGLVMITSLFTGYVARLMEMEEPERSFVPPELTFEFFSAVEDVIFAEDDEHQARVREEIESSGRRLGFRAE